MRIGELSRSTGVSVPTIKFYLREKLLHPGRATSPTQAQYDEGHALRLRLVRALVDVAGMSLAEVRTVVVTVDQLPLSGRDLPRLVHDALPPRVAADVDVSRAREVVDLLGWQVAQGSNSLRQLARTLAILESVGLPADTTTISRYGRAVEAVVFAEVTAAPASSPTDAVTLFIAGTALYEPVLLALRRLAQQNISARRSGRGRP